MYLSDIQCNSPYLNMLHIYLLNNLRKETMFALLLAHLYGLHSLLYHIPDHNNLYIYL